MKQLSSSSELNSMSKEELAAAVRWCCARETMPWRFGSAKKVTLWKLTITTSLPSWTRLIVER